MSNKRAEEYRKKHGTWVITVPSGAEFTVKKPSVLSMMRKGILPTRLYQAAVEQTDGAAKGKTVEADSEQETKDNVEFMTMYAVEASYDPKIVASGIEPKEGQLSIDELDDEDLNAIFTLVYSDVGRNKEVKDKVPASFSKEAGVPSH